MSGQVMAHKGCQRRLRGRVDKHAVHMYRQDISPPGCIAFTPSPPSPPSSLTHWRPDSRAKPRALSKGRHEQPKDESISDRISSLPDRIRKWVNQRRHAPARTFQALVCPPPLLSPMFCCCTNALCPPFYLSALPAVPASAAEDSSVTGRLSLLPHDVASPSCIVHAPGTLPFVIFCLIVLPDCLHTASL